MSMLDRMREDLRDFTLYAPGDGDDALIRLHANELPFRAPDDESDRGLHRYPLGRDARLRDRLAELYGVKPAQLLATRGSDDGIDLLVRTFCTAGVDNIIATRPGFGMYGAVARLQGCTTTSIGIEAHKDFDLDVSAVVDAANDNTKLVFLCSPNNPSGRVIPVEQIEQVCRALRDRALVVVDEAYGEFCAQPSAAERIDAHDNLVVLRTLSKAFGLAGARVGAVLGPAEIIATLDRLLTPFPLPSNSVDAALAVTDPASVAALRHRWRQIAEQRERLFNALQAIDVVRHVWPSDANFLLTSMREPRAVVARCRERGLLIRLIGSNGQDFVRITVGTPAQNDRLLGALRETS